MSAGGRDGYASGDDLSDVKSDLVSSAESEEKLFRYHSAPASPKRSVSQRSDIEFTLLSVRERVSSLERLAPVRALQSSKMTWS